MGDLFHDILSHREYRSAPAMKKALTIIIGFVHDFAAGCWAATVLAIYWLSKQSFSAEVGVIMLGLKKQLFWAGIACVVTVVLAGVGRTFTYAYVGSVYGEDAEKLRRRMLAVKHIILFTVFCLGIWWQYSMVFR